MISRSLAFAAVLAGILSATVIGSLGRSVPQEPTLHEPALHEPTLNGRPAVVSTATAG